MPVCNEGLKIFVRDGAIISAKFFATFAGIYLFIYLTLPMNKQHITFTNIDNWQGTRYSLRQLQRPSI